MQSNQPLVIRTHDENLTLFPRPPPSNECDNALGKLPWLNVSASACF